MAVDESPTPCATRPSIKDTKISSSSSDDGSITQVRISSGTTSVSEAHSRMDITSPDLLNPDISAIRTSASDNENANFNVNGGYDMTPFQPDDNIDGSNESREDPISDSIRTMKGNGNGKHNSNSDFLHDDNGAIAFTTANAVGSDDTSKRDGENENAFFAETKECEESLLSYIGDDGGESMSERYEEQLSRIEMYNSRIVDSDSEPEDEEDQLDFRKETSTRKGEEEDNGHYSGLVDEEPITGENDEHPNPCTKDEDKTATENATLIMQVNDTFGEFEKFGVECSEGAAPQSTEVAHSDLHLNGQEFDKDITYETNNSFFSSEGWTLHNHGAFEDADVQAPLQKTNGARCLESMRKEESMGVDDLFPSEHFTTCKGGDLGSNEYTSSTQREEMDQSTGEAKSVKDSLFSNSIPLLKPPPPEKMQAYLLSKGLVQSDDFASFPSNQIISVNETESQHGDISDSKNELETDNEPSFFAIFDDGVSCKSDSLVAEVSSAKAMTSDHKVNKGENRDRIHDSDCVSVGAIPDNKCSVHVNDGNNENGLDNLNHSETFVKCDKTKLAETYAKSDYPDDFFNSCGTNLQLSPSALNGTKTSPLLKDFLKNSPMETSAERTASDDVGEVPDTLITNSMRNETLLFTPCAAAHAPTVVKSPSVLQMEALGEAATVDEKIGQNGFYHERIEESALFDEKTVNNVSDEDTLVTNSLRNETLLFTPCATADASAILSERDDIKAAKEVHVTTEGVFGGGGDDKNTLHLSDLSREEENFKRRNESSPSHKPPLHPLGSSHHSSILLEECSSRTNQNEETRHQIAWKYSDAATRSFHGKISDNDKAGSLTNKPLLLDEVMRNTSQLQDKVDTKGCPSPESSVQSSKKDLRSGSFEYHPVSPKMAEKIALASSRADQKLSDLMLSLSASKSGENEQANGIRKLDPSPGSPKKLFRGAFNTLSNSATSSVSPIGSFEKVDVKKRLDLPSIVAAVEVQLSPRPKDKHTEFQNDSHQILTKWAYTVCDCANDEHFEDLSESESVSKLKFLLDNRDNMNMLCAHVTEQVKELNDVCEEEDLDACEITDEVQAGDPGRDMDRETLRSAALILLRETQKLHPFSLSELPSSASKSMIRTAFDTFLRKISQITGIDAPQIDRGAPPIHFLALGTANGTGSLNKETVQDSVLGSVFGQCTDVNFMAVLGFLYESSNEDSLPLPPPPELHGNVYKTDNAIIYDQSTSTDMMNYNPLPADEEEFCTTPNPSITERKNAECTTAKRKNKRRPRIPDSTPTILIPPPPPTQLYYNVPETSPCPFEIAVWNVPDIVLSILEWLGDPVAVCRIKMVNRFSSRIMYENEYKAMKTAVRLGGIPTYLRPAFWMWVTLEKCPKLEDDETSQHGVDPSSKANDKTKSSKDDVSSRSFDELERRGRASKWHNVIERDVVRAFGNLPPHKSKGSRRKSIVRALVSWGRSQIKKHHPEVVGKENPIRSLSMGSPTWKNKSFDEISFEHSDTVSDWGGISPVGSNISSVGSLARTDSLDFVLCGNGLTNEVKLDLQKKLEAILNAIAAMHEGVGYCQGMDYLVAHLLRVLQETIEWNAPRGKLPPCIRSAEIWAENEKVPLHETVVVEETIFRVMHTLMSTYGLRHMYWPELRALKTCCRVFEAIIEKKLPVLYDHFEHHDLNIGLFALGWFQTMFLYIPSMPSKTINHIWDIMLVERSMKIFFRVGTAILFLSQPILLNHELEGMMQYLNTFPDATILTHDILINCALQIKITNSMLAEIECWVVRKNEIALGLRDAY